MEETARQRSGKRSGQRRAFQKEGTALLSLLGEVRDDTLVLLLEQPGAL